MNTKTPIVRLFAEKLPETAFDPQSRPNLLFRNRLPNNLYQCLAIQRDSKSNGLAPNLAVTYSPVWRGEPAAPLGIDRGFPQLRQNSRLVEAIDYWYFHERTGNGLISAAKNILADFPHLHCRFLLALKPNYWPTSCFKLRAWREPIPAESRIGLPESLAAVRHVIAKCDHPAFLKLKDRIQAAWTEDVPKERRRWTNRLAYDTLVYV